MKVLAALLCVLVGALNLAAPYYPLTARTLLAANIVLLAIGVLALLTGRSAHSQADLDGPQLLNLRNSTEQQLAQANALHTRIKNLETDLATARRQAETAARHVPDTGAQAQVVNFLASLQEKGRLVDFLMDDIATYEDAQVGAAARIVHQGCSQVVRDYFELTPVRDDSEGSSVTLEANFDPREFRLVGRVAGQPPYRGTVLHRGWQSPKVKLPRLTSNPGAHTREVISPAEIELQ